MWRDTGKPGVWVVLFQGNQRTAHFCILSFEAAITIGDPRNFSLCNEDFLSTNHNDNK